MLQNAAMKQRERRNSLKKDALPAADAHPFAHRPRQLAPAAKRRGGERQTRERRRGKEVAPAVRRCGTAVARTSCSSAAPHVRRLVPSPSPTEEQGGGGW
jgi:hypothetical protein